MLPNIFANCICFYKDFFLIFKTFSNMYVLHVLIYCLGFTIAVEALSSKIISLFNYFCCKFMPYVAFV